MPHRHCYGGIMDKPDRHPIYDCKFWIYEERRLAPYEEYRDFYRRRVNGSDRKS